MSVGELGPAPPPLLPPHEQQVADKVCEQLLGQTRHSIGAAELMGHAQQAIRDLRASISLESLAEMASALVVMRLGNGYRD
ncbi:hypothetical protein [Nakamurella sp. PAMC28650]|uniref:hypothetical protein n=1 Tax=Nakamurella sp. PAMC28650 TaxID=2762325 RepID=UPI00164ED923|nr:hypothetical protein [Nakamurella sp. PAMC28650]QNK80382.1 hypothetical protein H7F38_19630 [Nakamurella sp. PAMC28650]